MTDLFLIPVVMLAVFKPDSNYVTSLKPFATVEECIAELPEARAGWREEYPSAVIWCADPIGRAIYPDPTAEP